MGISRDSLHKRRSTGGRKKHWRKGKKYEMGRVPANTKLSSAVAVRRLRVRGFPRLRLLEFQKNQKRQLEPATQCMQMRVCSFFWHPYSFFLRLRAREFLRAYIHEDLHMI